MSEIKGSCFNGGCGCNNNCGNGGFGGFGGWEILIILIIIFCFCGGGFSNFFGGCCNN